MGHARAHANVHAHTPKHAPTHRFDSGIEECFKDILKFFEANPDVLDYLTDKGTRKVSRKYRAEWEKCFRNAALSG